MEMVNAAIEKYLKEEIALSKKDISKAVKSREWFLDRLYNLISSKKDSPILLKELPFKCYGSYVKGTKVRDVDEFDVLVIIDSNDGVFSKGGNETGKGIGTASPNPKYLEKYKKSDGSGVSPAKMLNWLRSQIKEITDSFGGEAPERNGQAVTATIKSLDLALDFVPAGVFRRMSDSSVFFNIPRGDKENGWIVTSPDHDANLLEQAATGRTNLKNVIRLSKRIKDTYNFLVPSFALETAMIYYVSSRRWYNNLFFDVCYFLEFVADSFSSGKIQDSYDPQVNLIEGVESLSWYSERLTSIIQELGQCDREYDDFDTIYSVVFDLFENR